MNDSIDHAKSQNPFPFISTRMRGEQSVSESDVKEQ